MMQQSITICDMETSGLETNQIYQKPKQNNLSNSCPDLSGGCPGIQDLSSGCAGRHVLPGQKILCLFDFELTPSLLSIPNWPPFGHNVCISQRTCALSLCGSKNQAVMQIHIPLNQNKITPFCVGVFSNSLNTFMIHFLHPWPQCEALLMAQCTDIPKCATRQEFLGMSP